MKTNRNAPQAGKISKSQLQALVEHIVRGVVREVETAKANAQKKRWTVKLEKEQTGTAAAAPVTGPNAFKKKTTFESATTPDSTDDDTIPGKFVDRGEIKLEGGLDYDTANKIANYHWYILGSYGKDDRGVWNFKTIGERWCCSVGMLNGKPAILSVTTTPGRLNLLVGDEAYPQLKEMTTTSGGGGSSAGTPGYNIPGAWAGGSLEKNKKHIEVLGYTLTPAGKKEMKRAGDNLYEGVEKGKKQCQNCGESMDVNKTKCPNCKFLNDDTPEDKKLKYGSASLQENELAPGFDRAQQQHDNELPDEDLSGDGIECPECGAHRGYVTDKGHSGSAYWIQMKCDKCGGEWGHDNFDALQDR